MAVWQIGTSYTRLHSPGRSSSLQSLFMTQWPMILHVWERHCHLQLKGRSRRRMTTRSWPDWYTSEARSALYLLMKMSKYVWKPSRLPIRADVVCPQCYSDNLPHNANLQLGRKENDACPLCREGQTLIYVLNCCRVAKTWGGTTSVMTFFMGW